MNWRIALGTVVLLVFVGACSDSAETTPEANNPVVQNLGTLEQGETYSFRFHIHCGMKWFESFNGTAWVSDDPIYGNSSRRPPQELRQFLVNPDEVISPVLRTLVTLVAADEIQLTLPDGSQSSTYHPTDEEWPGCA